jgi:hypothetical protein
MATHKYSDKFFGGVDQVKRRLVEAIFNARDGVMSCEDLDKWCGPLYDSDHITCAGWEKNPQLMNGAIFSLVSFGLDLKLDDVLTPTLEPGDVESIAKEMNRTGSRAVYAMESPNGGDGSVHDLELEHQVRVYVLLKIMEEIDGLKVSGAV